MPSWLVVCSLSSLMLLTAGISPAAGGYLAGAPISVLALESGGKLFSAFAAQICRHAPNGSYSLVLIVTAIKSNNNEDDYTLPFHLFEMIWADKPSFVTPAQPDGAGQG